MPDPAPVSPTEQSAPVVNSDLPRSRPVRSGTRLLVVRIGLFCLLAGLVWELYARNSFAKTLNTLESKLEAQRTSIVQEKANAEKEMEQRGESRNSRTVAELVMARMVPAPKASEVGQFISGLPTRKVTENSSAMGPMRHEIYVWPSLFKRYELHLNYGVGDDPALITVDSTSGT